MHNLKLAAALVLAFSALAAARPALAAAKPTRFWNLTSATVTDLRLAPAGTDAFGENQCLNDKDKEVDHDERLKVVGVESGQYDAQMGFEDGRVCAAKNLSIEAGQVFSIEDKDLVDCSERGSD
jgi:hypothetical protein